MLAHLRTQLIDRSACARRQRRSDTSTQFRIMGLRVLADEYWPEVTSAANLSKQQGCEVWEFSSASDQDDMEAEQAALQQHILALADPTLQFSSLEALTAPRTDLTALPDAASWDSLCQGLTACLASNSKPTLLSASSLITTLAHDHSRLGDHACTAQLFCCMAAAAEQASSVEASAAIWQACLPLVRSLALQLPQMCMHHSEGLLAKMVEAFCKLLVLCVAGSPLHSSVVFAIGGGDPLDWWHSWLARSRLAKVVPACLESSGLLDAAISMLQKACCHKEPSAMGRLAAVHVLGGTLSLSRGRGLFPRPAPGPAPGFGPGPAPGPALITAQQAVQMLIELQQATQPEHGVVASPKGGQSPPESTQTAVGLELCVVSSAAKRILQNLAEQHSCKCQPIFSNTHVQQLLQPSLEAFCQPQETTRLKGSAPSAKGSAPAVEGSTPGMKGRAYDAMGNAAIVKGTLTPMEGAVTPSEGECLPLDVETANGYFDAAGVPAHNWQKLRDSWEILTSLCRSAMGCHTAMATETQASDGKQTPSIIAAAAGMLQWLLHSTSSPCGEEDNQLTDAAASTMLPMLRALSSLGQQYSCFEALHTANVPGTLLQLLEAEIDALGGQCLYEGILECVLSMCCQPLVALHVSQRPQALQVCATRLASKAGQDHSLDWLHQASGLGLTQAGQRALLQAGLPQELLHQLQQLPMQLPDSDSEACKEQKHARALHKCQVVFSWHNFGVQLLPDPAANKEVPSLNILQGLCGAALQASPCPLASSPGCPALPTLEGAAAAVELLAAACLPLHCRWCIDTRLDLSQWLLQQMQSQEEECGSVIVDLLTVPKGRLLSMLDPTHGFAYTQPDQHPQQGPAAGPSTSKAAPAGSAPGMMSLSELSVSDPGMKQPEVWWSQVQMALLEGIQQGQLQWRALPLILQRTVLVAMKALSQDSSPPFALTPAGLMYSTQNSSSSITPAQLNSTGQPQPVAKVSMSAACRASVEAFVSGAQQQLPALAQSLQAHHLQDFLCAMHAQWQGLQESAHQAAASVVEDLDCFASVIWLIMRGDPISQEFLAAVTASQAAMYLWPALIKEAAGQATRLRLGQCLGMMLQQELPLLHAALLQCGLHAGHMVSMWHQQSFVGVTGMPDAVCYIIMGLILGTDWLLYFMLAVLKQQEMNIRHHLLHVGSLDGWVTSSIVFEIRTAVPFMRQMQERWSETLLQSLVKHIDA